MITLPERLWGQHLEPMRSSAAQGGGTDSSQDKGPVMRPAVQKKRHLIKVLLIHPPVCVVCLLLLSGCALMGVNSEPQLPSDLPATWAAEVEMDQLPIAAHLLDLVDENQLRELVQEALANNPDLNATALRLKAAGFMLSEPRSRLLPQVNAGFSRGRDNQQVNAKTGKKATANSHRLTFGVGWEIDLWGKLADEYAASNYAVLAKKHDYQHARDALAVHVIQAWIEQVAVRRSLAISAERVTVLQRIETVLVERFKDGIGKLDELSTARSRTEIARADQSSQEADWFRAVRELEILLGRYPRGELLAGRQLPAVAPPPVGIPAATLLNRPDIQAALARVASARNLSRAAQKALLPQLRFSGQLFKTAASLGDINGATTYWSMLGSLFQPLFEGGRLIDASKARRTEAEAALMELHTIVLRALKEVEDAFDQERRLTTQALALEVAVKESQKSSRYYEERYRQGLDTIQSLLIAKEQEMAVRMRWNAVLAERLNNRIDLALGLGIGEPLRMPSGASAS